MEIAPFQWTQKINVKRLSPSPRPVAFRWKRVRLNLPSPLNSADKPLVFSTSNRKAEYVSGPRMKLRYWRQRPSVPPSRSKMRGWSKMPNGGLHVNARSVKYLPKLVPPAMWMQLCKRLSRNWAVESAALQKSAWNLNQRNNRIGRNARHDTTTKPTHQQ